MIWWLENKKSYIFYKFLKHLAFILIWWQTDLWTNYHMEKLGKLTLSQFAHCATTRFNVSALLQSAQISAPKSSVTFTVSFQLSFHHPSFHEWYVSFIDLRVEFSQGYVYVHCDQIFFVHSLIFFCSVSDISCFWFQWYRTSNNQLYQQGYGNTGCGVSHLGIQNPMRY